MPTKEKVRPRPGANPVVVGSETAKQTLSEGNCMCQYCNYGFDDGWSQLIEYDEVYQQAMAATTEAEYGFHESWDELSEEVY